MKKQPFFSTIDFDKLYKKILNPPFKPAVVQTDDAFYFDQEFTSRTPKGNLLRLQQTFVIEETTYTLCQISDINWFNCKSLIMFTLIWKNVQLSSILKVLWMSTNFIEYLKKKDLMKFLTKCQELEITE